MKNKIKQILRENTNKDTKLISAFPGSGKSHYFRNTDKYVLDSDSSKFDKSKFPENYIKHIKNNMGKVDIIMISSHKEVRDALVDNELSFTLVYPDKSLKDEYISRYKERGNDDKFVELLDKNWDTWIGELETQDGCKHIKLHSGQYLSDILK